MIDLVLPLLAWTSLNAAHAENLNDYRQSILSGARTTAEDSLARTQSLKSALGTAAVNVTGLDEIPLARDHRHRFYSSLTLKDILQSGVAEAMRARLFDGPMSFDPSWSPQEHRQVLNLQKRRVCVRSIQGSHRDATGRPDGMAFVVGQIYTRLALPESRDEFRRGSKGVPANPGEAPMRQVIAAHLGAAPRNAEGKSVTDVLGEVGRVEIVDGLVHRVFLGTGAAEVEASLAMMLTTRLGQDGDFLQMQDCLFDYLTDQRAVFERRQGEMTSWQAYNPFKAGYDYLLGLFRQVDENKAKIMAGAADKSRAAREIQDMYDSIQDQDPTAQYLAQRRFFAEGHDWEKESESDFIGARLEQLKYVLPFLEERVKTARATHDKLMRLGRDQINYVLSMLIDLRGRDLPTVNDMIAMPEAFGKADDASFAGRDEKQISGVEKDLIDKRRADFLYYRVIGTQLTDLENLLRSEPLIEAAKRKELEIIRGR